MTKPSFSPAFLRGIQHFNALEFWEAHEAWEELWLEAESDLVEFLQGLIQLAAAYHHVRRGTLKGAVRLFDSSLRRLASFPLVFCGVNRSRAEAAAHRDRARAAAILDGRETTGVFSENDYPKLDVLNSDEPVQAPQDPW